MHIKLQRGPGGGKIIRKRVQRKWLYEVIMTQQKTINEAQEAINGMQSVLKEAQRQYHAEVERIKAAGSTPQIEALTKLTVDLSLENQKLRSKIDSL